MPILFRIVTRGDPVISEDFYQYLHEQKMPGPITKMHPQRDWDPFYTEGIPARLKGQGYNFKGLNSWSADDEVTRTDLRLFKKLKILFKDSQFWFTPRGWGAFGRDAYEYLKERHPSIKYLKEHVDEDFLEQAIYKDEYQVAI